MSFLPPVVQEIRANASQFISEQGKVIEAARVTASETEKAAQKEAAAARAAAAEATRSAEQRVAAAETSAKAAVAATDRRIAAEAQATAAQAKATEMQAALTEESTAAQKAAYDAQAAAAAKAASAVELAAAKENEAQVKAAQAATLSAEAQAKAADLQMVSAEKSAAAHEVAATRTTAAMNSVVGVANKVSAVTLLVGAGVAFAATEMAAKFEKSTMLLVTAGGESLGALNDVRKGLLEVSTQTGTSAEQMSEGMYVMEKAGLRGAAGLSALKMAAEGAKDENVDLGIMTQALTDLLLDYGTNTKDAAEVTRDSVKYTNELVAASGAAKTTMTDFANSMAAVVPIASTAKISFDQVGGAIATMTQHGQTAQQSSQNLANLIQSLVRPNNLASAAMSQLGIDTTDLAQHLGERGLYGTLKIVDDAIKSHMTPDLMVHTGTMKDNANAAKAMDTIMGQMSPTMANLSKGLQDGTVTQKQYSKAAKDLGGDAGALGNQFLGLYKANSGVTDSLKAGKPATETYAAALRDVLGNVTAMRSAQMLLMNNGREFEANIKAIGEAGKKTGSDIATWADMQQTLSVQMNQTKEMVSNLGIEMGSKLLPVAKNLVSGFTDLFHGLEKGDPILYAAAAVLGGALLISTVNLTQKLVLMGVAGVTNFVNLGKSAVTMGSQFLAGLGSAEAAASSFTGKAGTLGGFVSRMGPALTGAAVGAGILTAAILTLEAAQNKWGTNNTAPKADEIAKALEQMAAQADGTGARMDNLFKQFDSGPLKAAPKNVNDLDSAIKAVTHEGFDDTMNKVGDAISTAFGAGNTSAISQVEDRFKGVGDQLGKLVGDGHIDVAARSFDTLAKKFAEQGKTAQDALDLMPAYKQALEDQAHAAGKDISQQELLEFAMGKVPQSMLDAMDATQKYTDAAGEVKPITPELQKSLDEAGVSADGLASDLEKVITGMESAGLLALSTRDAQFKFADAIDKADVKAKELKDSLHGDLSTALNDTGTDFNQTTAAGKAAEDQFAAVSRSGLEQAQAMAKSGASHEQLQGVLTETVNKMKHTAESFGLGSQQAEDLTRNVLGIPPKADITTWMDDYALNKAQQVKNAVDNIPTNKLVSITFATTATGPGASQIDVAMANGSTERVNRGEAGYYTGGLVGLASGGAVDSIMGFADGGLIPGRAPVAPNVDNILALVDGKPLKVRSGEYINNEPSTKMNLPWLKASNAGLNIGKTMQQRFQTGYALGQQTQPAMAGAPASNTNINITAQTNATGEHIAKEVAWTLRTL